jgi:hypothetical protein
VYCGAKLDVRSFDTAPDEVYRQNPQQTNPDVPQNKARTNYRSSSVDSGCLIYIIGAIVLVLAVAACFYIDNGGNFPGFNFNIEGSWENDGDVEFGQMVYGSTVVFDGDYCNVVSPSDTYEFYKSGDMYTLECTTMWFGDTLSFDVEVLDNNNIYIYTDSGTVELTRIE